MSEKKNKLKSGRENKILIVITILLAILYTLSFVKNAASDKRDKVKTALVNPKYKESIDSIRLQDSSSCIELKKENGFWIVHLTPQENSLSEKSYLQISLPLSQEKINNLLEELIRIRNMYKISDKINKNNSLGLTNGTEFHITYKYQDLNTGTEAFRELIFGNQDFSLSSRYMMTGENTQVYEIDNSMDLYLTTSIQSWAEPYIISRTTANTDIQSLSIIFTDEKKKKSIKKIREIDDNVKKLLDLRHGGLPSSDEVIKIDNTEADTEIEIENGDKSKIILKITQSDEQEGTFIVKTLYFRPDEQSAFYTSYSKISSWTYNKIKEITL